MSTQDWPAYRDLRLRALADAPDAFGSLLEYEQTRSDTDWRERVATAAESPRQYPVFAVSGEELIGLIWGRLDHDQPTAAHIFQLWVAPAHRRTGAGELLLNSVVEWARAANARTLDLRVTTGDTPATRLYERAGFRPTGHVEPLRPGSPLKSQRMRLDLRSA
jgi:ribosomal protein S18 acetylase RimI-like enzyme